MRSLGIAAIVTALSAPAFALKYAAPEHKLAVDPDVATTAATSAASVTMSARRFMSVSLQRAAG